MVVRESEEGPGAKVGGIVSTRRRLFSERGAKKEAASAIIVHPRPDQPRNVSFNLTVNKNRSIRGPRIGRDSTESEDPTHDFTLPLGRPKSGFDFNLDAAADADDAVGERDIENEMLDIMQIDDILDGMEDDRGSGRKKVFFG